MYGPPLFESTIRIGRETLCLPYAGLFSHSLFIFAPQEAENFSLKKEVREKVTLCIFLQINIVVVSPGEAYICSSSRSQASESRENKPGDQTGLHLLILQFYILLIRLLFILLPLFPLFNLIFYKAGMNSCQSGMNSYRPIGIKKTSKGRLFV